QPGAAEAPLRIVFARIAYELWLDRGDAAFLEADIERRLIAARETGVADDVIEHGSVPEQKGAGRSDAFVASRAACVEAVSRLHCGPSNRTADEHSMPATTL